ncbi:histidine kinase N-terminal 7TM domain-containing protein [Haloferax sp. S1W]|uniref:histidine kinase N-terminal 7TM domain-containing protein n=1 Tax=Haloferax sp. S1W TaxID=3377110 RepID=UPI0037CAE8F5
MGWTVSVFAVVVLGSAVVALGVGLASLRQRPDPMAWPLAVLMFAIAAWAVPHAIILGYTELERVIFWERVRYLGVVSAPVMYLVVALRYAGYERWLSRRTYALLAVVPVITVVAVWTNPSHELFWRSVSLARVGDASVLVPEVGVWYWVNLGYLYLVTATAMSVLGIVVIRSGPLYRKQAVLMFVGGLVPLATNVVMIFGAGPEPMVDLTTTALTVSGVTFALALFHFDLLEIRPVARDLLINELDDGVVVIGPTGRISDFNPMAANILEDLAINQPAAETLPSNVVLGGGKLVIETSTGERTFRTRSTSLTDKRDQEVGRIVYLHDITEVVKREQRISVLNRVLRHNIRNELNIVSGRLELLEEQTTAGAREHIESAKKSTQLVIELAEKARHIEQTLKETDAMVVVSAPAAAERAVTNARKTYSDAVIKFECPERSENSASVCVMSETLFTEAIAELIGNAVIHNDREPPEATVYVDSDAEHVRVSVADTGPGLPEQEKSILRSPTETNLEHGSGLGLWLVKWTASLSSGTLTFAENDPRGTIATVTLPLADE